MTEEPSDAATRDLYASRVALVTCDHFPDLHEYDHPLRDALRARDVIVDAVRWDDDTVAWNTYDLVVLRSPWDYVPRRDAFVTWARGVPALDNPAEVIEWNTDKRYLGELSAAGLPVISTEFVEPGETWTPPSSGEWVLKPTVSAGSQQTGRYTMPEHAEVAALHVRRMHDAGRTVMVQPYLEAVDTAGETALLFILDAHGELTFSHAIRKGPLLTGPDEGRPMEEYVEEITPRTPSAAELAVAERVLAGMPFGSKELLYARVDLIPGPDGEPLVLELELTEPSLFFPFAPGSADRMADAIVARI